MFKLTGMLLTFVLAAGTGYSQSSDDDAGKKAFEKVCFDCHGTEMVDGRGLSRADWQETVDSMVRKGARGTDDELAAIVDYLAKNYPLPKINVNTEGAPDLEIDLEIPRKAADAIVDYREKHGKFKTLEELENVPGLDAAKIEAKKDRVAF